jgi:glycosyltransferase involved in cell wall biosynthesis
LTLGALSTTFIPAPQIIVSFHGSDVTGLQYSAPVKLDFWREFLKRAHGVVVCSSSLGQRVSQLFGFAPIVIHNGIDSVAFCNMAGPQQAATRRTILSVGKFEVQKGQDVLIKAFASLVYDYSDLDLCLVGATASNLQPLRQLCVQLGIQHRVYFRPDVLHNDVARCFAVASIFVLPSRQEAFGLVLLEAGCLALPVVATAVGGVPEILEDGVTALLIEPNRSDKLALALRAILDDEVAAQAMGAQLRAHVVKNFSWINAHGHYVELARSRPKEH